MTLGASSPPAAAKADPEGWVFVCADAELGATPKAVWADRQLVVWRTAAGKLVALDDKCPHQGGALSAGVVVGEAIRCPMHGWEVAADGWCDPAGAGVAAHEVAARDGGIFVRVARRR